MQTGNNRILLMLADGSCLNHEDEGQGASPRSIERRVCRFLKQQDCLPVLSQSHSSGAALLAAGSVPFAVGVDMEAIRPRDFRAAAALSCSRTEQRWLAKRGWQAEDYYRLWVLKEALIKASAADFPADLPRVGAVRRNGSLILHAAGAYWHGFAGICRGWALAAVWPEDKHPACGWRRFGIFGQPGYGIKRIWLF